MKNAAIIFLSFAALLLFAESAYSGGNTKSTAGAYLRLGVGARPLGMGGAFTAVANDVYATYWNPAGLVQLQSFQIGSMYTIMTLDRKYSFLSFALPIGNSLALGITGIDYRIGQIERRDETETLLGTFDNAENAFSVSIGISPLKNLYLGGNYKFLLHQLADKRATGYGFDVGVLLRPLKYFSVGMVVQDMNSNLEWNTDSNHEDHLPLSARGGVALRLLDDRLLVSTDLVKIKGVESTRWHTGVEFWPLGFFATRTGYNDQALTVGATLKISSLQFDYGFATDEIDASQTHRISLLIDFKR